MRRAPRLVAALKMVPGLRESSYVVRAAGRATANALFHSLTGRTQAASRLQHAFTSKPHSWGFESTAEERPRFAKTWELVEPHAAPPDLQERWWARRLAWGARAQHDRCRIDGLVPIAEAFVCGDARVTTVFRKPPRC